MYKLSFHHGHCFKNNEFWISYLLLGLVLCCHIASVQPNSLRKNTLNMPEKSGHRLAAILTVPIKQTNTSPFSSLPVSQRRVIGCHVSSRNFVYQKQIIFGKAVHTCMSFNNVKLVHTFGSFIYFTFPASADNMSDMRSGGWGRNTPFNTRS